MEFRECTKEDILFIQNYQKRYVMHYEDPTMADLKEVLELLYTKIEGNVNAYRSIYVNNIKAGYVHVIEQIDFTYLLDDLYIKEPYRNQGIGTEVLNRMIEESEGNLYVYMYVRNTKLIDFFAKRGFMMKRIISKTRIMMQYEKKQKIS